MRNSSIDGAGVETYFTYDGLGSTADLTDDAATVTDTYSYDVFGDATHVGSSTNYWQFTGEQHDGSEGLYYLRARYYDAATGRFLSQDPLGIGYPYAYTGNSPVNFVDPSGLHCKVWHPHHCPGEAIGKLFSCLNDPFKCTYGQRSTLVRLLETAFFAGSGGTVIDKEGGIRVLSECTGACQAFLNAFGEDAFVIGHTIFFNEAVDPDLLPHELKHVRQYEIFGDLFLPLYFGPGFVTGLVGCAATGLSADCLHDYNLLEFWADR